MLKQKTWRGDPSQNVDNGNRKSVYRLAGMWDNWRNMSKHYQWVMVKVSCMTSFSEAESFR